jgi:hypothetical protein
MNNGAIPPTTAIELPANQQPLVLRAFAHFVSVVFHPLFIPVYLAAVIIFIHPYYFAGFDEKRRMLNLLQVFMLFSFFPALTVFLLWKLDLTVKSVFLRTQKERIVPYIASMVFFFWSYYVYRNQPHIPRIMTVMSLGVFLSCISALIANIYIKISMHAMAVGGMVVILVIIALTSTINFALPVIVGIFIAGLVCTARMIVSDHKWHDLYWGFLTGIVCQLVAYWMMG